MEIRPIIAYIEPRSKGVYDDNNPDRDALQYFLREQGYEVIVYDYFHNFEGDIATLKKYHKANQLLLVLVCQSKYMDDHDKTISLVRKELSAEMPIVIFPEGFQERFQENQCDPFTHIFDHTDAELTEYISYLNLRWEPPTNAFGVETTADRNILLSQLETAYTKHYLQHDDERMFGTPDFNHSVVAEALRIRLLPSAVLKEEFDDTFEEDHRVFSPSKPSVYLQELRRVTKMTVEERTRFDHTLSQAMGREPVEGGGVRVTRASFGNTVNGFAIDPLTLETFTTHRFGEHNMAGDVLVRRIHNIEALRKRKSRWDMSDDEERSCRWRIITGLIFSEIDGFETPILQLYVYEKNKNHVRRVARFLKEQQIFIPVTPDGKILGG